jgi:hypothetical protein
MKENKQEQYDSLGYEWWEEALMAQKVIQKQFPECVLVGGTATAIHCKHRMSYDFDYVLPTLKEKFEAILAELERQSGWKTNRVVPPVVILGNFEGVETGLRQLIRTSPLETMVVRGVRIPTLVEMARIKAFLIVKRNTTRDFLDFCALADKLTDNVISALSTMDDLYPTDKSEGAETVLRQLAKQLAEPMPYDLKKVNLDHYRGLRSPYNNWRYIIKRCQQISLDIVSELILRNEQKSQTPMPKGRGL